MDGWMDGWVWMRNLADKKVESGRAAGQLKFVKDHPG
jgi:hypothetical protein